MLALSLVVTIAALVAASSLVAGSDGAPVAGVLAVGGTGLVVLGALGWIRQLPVKPGDAAGYGRAAVIKLAVAEVPVLIGFVAAGVFGPWWVAAVGGGFSLVALALSWPSHADRERHELLYLV